MKYKLSDGSIYEGPVCKMPDGRIKTGATLNGDSLRAWPIEDHQLERARNESGAFVADDPATPQVNEAYRAKRKPRGKVKSK